MKYYLAEIYITHRKTWFGWIEYSNKLSTILVEAKDYIEAHKKTLEWAKCRIKEMKGEKKWKYQCFTTSAI